MSEKLEHVCETVGRYPNISIWRDETNGKWLLSTEEEETYSAAIIDYCPYCGVKLETAAETEANSALPGTLDIRPSDITKAIAKLIKSGGTVIWWPNNE